MFVQMWLVKRAARADLRLKAIVQFLLAVLSAVMVILDHHGLTGGFVIHPLCTGSFGWMGSPKAAKLPFLALTKPAKLPEVPSIHWTQCLVEHSQFQQREEQMELTVETK
jgi:hypothetical protein